MCWKDIAFTATLVIIGLVVIMMLIIIARMFLHLKNLESALENAVQNINDRMLSCENDILNLGAEHVMLYGKVLDLQESVKNTKDCKEQRIKQSTVEDIVDDLQMRDVELSDGSTMDTVGFVGRVSSDIHAKS